MKFLRFDELKHFLELTLNETQYPILEEIELSVIAAIENVLKRSLSYGLHVEEFDGYNSKLIGLKAIPIKEIEAVYIDDVLTSTFRKTGWGLMLDYKQFESLISIEYYGGYAPVESDEEAPSLPEDLYRALFLQTIFEYQSRDYVGASSITNEGGSVNKPGLEIMDEVVRLLGPHKHPLNCGI